ncbi:MULTISPECIES: hypothetical protein [unclassified Frankia]|uniref:hypothetical protein n=1 Tax=unclassified Frankia TaxID=2632575 RepID=UPI001EF65BEE|nr:MULTISPECIES: hypothetical protein [unclassified Frankia]
MRVRVKFRYRVDTGEVEVFRVEDTAEGAPAADHDARHDRVTADVARIVENNALIEQEVPEPPPAARDQLRPRPIEEPPTGQTGQTERGPRLRD